MSRKYDRWVYNNEAGTIDIIDEADNVIDRLYVDDWVEAWANME